MAKKPTPRAKPKPRKPKVEHSLFDVLFIERVFTLPEKCPHCKAALTESSAVDEWNWNDCSVASHLDLDAGILDPEGYTETGETYYPSAIWCRRCSKPIVSASQGTLGAKDMTTPDRLAAVLREARGEE
jgi:hypothetical protein